MATERPKLMIPGPVDVDEDVLAAMSEPVRPHYGDEWLEINHEVIAYLKQIFGTQNDLFMMAGPGSAALDAALGSLMQSGDKVLVAHNGFFGERFVSLARAYGLEARSVTAPLGHPIEPEAIRRVLAADPEVQAVAVVHLETSTAVLNPVEGIAAAARDFGVPVIVDAVSSLGGVPLLVDEWGVDVCVSVANKCLACPAGIAPISVSQRAWDQIERKGPRDHGWYLNLETWKDYADRWGFWHPTPTTMPTNVIYALLVRLRRIMEQGLAEYYQRHVQAAQGVRAGLRRLGFETFTADEYSSPLLTAVWGLSGMDVEDMRRYLAEEWQIMVSGGLDKYRGRIFRVGHMGKASSQEYVDQFLTGVEAYLRLQGLNVPPLQDGG